MKEFFLLLYTSIFTSQIPPELARIDSLQRKNWIEVGTTSVALPGKNGSSLAAFNPGYPSYFAYKRQISRKGYVGVSYDYLSQDQRYISYDNIGTNLNTSYRQASLSIGRIHRDRGFRFLYSADIAYRWGKGHEVLTAYSPGQTWPDPADNVPAYIRIERSGFNSFGPGVSVDMNYAFLNRVTVGISSSYHYFFEKSRLNNDLIQIDTYSGTAPMSTFIQEYEPNRQLLTVHVKVGFLF